MKNITQQPLKWNWTGPIRVGNSIRPKWVEFKFVSDFYVPPLLKGSSITCEYTKLSTTRKNKMYLGNLAQEAVRNRGSYINPFMQNGISHSYQLEQSISVLTDVWWYFSFLFK